MACILIVGSCPAIECEIKQPNTGNLDRAAYIQKIVLGIENATEPPHDSVEFTTYYWLDSFGTITEKKYEHHEACFWK